MSILTSLGIVFLAMLTHCFFQLPTGVFTIFYHYTTGKSSIKKADGLTIYYILGMEIFLTTVFIIVHCIFFYIFINAGSLAYTILPWILSGVFFALSIASFIFYFRKGKFTELFISRSLSKKLSENAKNVKTVSDAFILGFVSCMPELIFTLPLFIATVFSLTYISYFPRSLFVLLYIIIAILPIFYYHYLYRTGHNLAEIERRRIKNKFFYKLIISIGFLVLAFIILNLGLGNG